VQQQNRSYTLGLSGRTFHHHHFISSSSDIYNQGREATGNDLKPSSVIEDQEKEKKRDP
jgi:hypothetical protein